MPNEFTHKHMRLSRFGRKHVLKLGFVLLGVDFQECVGKYNNGWNGRFGSFRKTISTNGGWFNETSTWFSIK